MATWRFCTLILLCGIAGGIAGATLALAVRA